MKHSVIRKFFSQHRTPIVPQIPVETPLVVDNKAIRVAYLLTRNQVVKHNAHPLETEMGYLIDREHQRYSRHDVETATHFLASRGQTMDVANRVEPGQIEGDYFNLELYQDAMKVMLQRYSPQKRVTPHDFYDPCNAELASKPPQRTALNRALDDFLYLIVKDKDTGKWTLPSDARAENETLRMTLDRSIFQQLGDSMDCYVWSNAPTAVLKSAADPTASPKGATEVLTFVFNATYLAGRPKMENLNISDHAWVRRCELPQYSVDGYQHDDMLDVLMDITLDSVFDTAPMCEPQ